MMRFLVRKATNVGIAPTLRGFTRHYSLRASPSPNGKITSFMENKANASMCVAVLATATANFLYWMDFNGSWARKAADKKREREIYAQDIQCLKRNREDLKAYVLAYRKKTPKGRKYKLIGSNQS